MYSESDDLNLTAPDYYSLFKCIADKCRHSCCVGWEIDIDEDTLEAYKNIQGEFGKKLDESVEYGGEDAHFKLTEEERCPFLNGKGLCDIILNLGEGKLCQICSDHPRFRNFYTDFTEIGLGLCCEAAGRLILGNEEKVTIVTLENNGRKGTLFPYEVGFLQYREKIFNILQDRTESIDNRVKQMLEFCNTEIPKKSYAQWAEIYLNLERLDYAWGGVLRELSEVSADKLILPGKEWDTAFEQLIVYFIYRHLAGALNDDRIANRVAFAALSFSIVRAVFALLAEKSGSFVLDDLVEAARLYSSEIEYSEENMEALLSVLDAT